MKIFAATDMHLHREENFRYFEEFCKFVNKNNPDAIILLGDFCETAFPRQKDMEEYLQLRQPMEQLADYELGQRSRHKKIDISLYELDLTLPIIAEEILFKKPYPKEIKAMAEAYLNKLDEAEWYLNNICHIANRHIDKEKTIVIPGNHDINLEQTVLKGMNLHLKSKTISTFKIAGYGGAADQGGRPLFSGCPPELTTPYNEYVEEKETLEGKTKVLISEPRDFFSEEQPDIALLHNPIYGFFDRSKLMGGQHTGSKGLAEYAKNGTTKLFLSGHIHEDIGIAEIKTQMLRTAIAVNPGPLGNTNVEGGHFIEVEMDDETKDVACVRFYKVGFKEGFNLRYSNIGLVKSFVKDNVGRLFEIKLV